ncbi:hypothetical protein [Nocardia sp. NPDC127526]|uniref:hypothetical protein n=1 Tax=Nocardia sp. NPDC127526 TaxID=3345393 RepID=UPI0036420B0C
MADEHRGGSGDSNDQSGSGENVAPGGHFGAGPEESERGAQGSEDAPGGHFGAAHESDRPGSSAQPPVSQPPAGPPATPRAEPPAASPVSEPPAARPAAPPAAHPAPRRGSIIQQEPGVTTARVPTVAEARARAKARYQAEEKAKAEAEADEAKRKSRKRLMIGGAAVVGVAALVGGGYLAYSAIKSPEVTAYCTIIAKKGQEVTLANGQKITATQDNQEIVVPDNYCEDGSRAHGGGIGGIFILNGSQYRYYYGGNNTIGQAPTGGTTVAPKGASIKTKTGTTIQRGGLGAKLGGGGS